MVQKGGAGHGKAIPCQRKTVMELSKMAILRVSRSAYATVSERRDKGGREKIGSKKMNLCKGGKLLFGLEVSRAMGTEK